MQPHSTTIICACGCEQSFIPQIRHDSGTTRYIRGHNGRGKSHPGHGPKPRPAEERFWAMVQKTDTCWLWVGKRSAKPGYYGSFNVGGTNAKTVRTSRFAFELTNGPIPDGLDVLHTCDNPPCVNPAHLYLGDAMRNSRDAVERGRMRKGNRHPWSRLTEDDVRAIRSSSTGKRGEQLVLARRFGVGRGNISAILCNKSWKGV